VALGAVGDIATVGVSQNGNTSNNFTQSNTCASIAAVSVSGGALTVTATGAGTCAITVTGLGGATISIPVTVTVTTGSVN
jgi:hypothetical protein